MTTSLALYEKFFVKNNHERTDLFEQLAARHRIDRALYPGSFVHVTPSFTIPHVTYVDLDRRCPRFFEDDAVHALVSRRKRYEPAASIEFLAEDFTRPLDLEDDAFDLMISQWTVPASRSCKRHLKIGGLLLVNDSHADATVAFVDGSYDLISVVEDTSGKHVVSDTDLETYFEPKSGQRPTVDDIPALKRGPAYRREAAMYLFRRAR